jgi:hypothetical protein
LKKMIPTHDVELRAIKEAREISQYREWSRLAEESLELVRD